MFREVRPGLKNVAALLTIIGLLLVTISCQAATTPTPTVTKSGTSPTAVQPPTPTALPTTTPTPKPKTKVTARMDFAFTGAHAPFFLAAEKGWYAENGLEVELREGTGSGPNITLITGKQETFVFADGATMAGAVAKGTPIKMVAAIYREAPQSLMALPNTKLSSPKDLEGKTIGLVPGTLVMKLWPGLVEKYQLDLSKINVVTTDLRTKRTLLLTNKLDVMQGAVADYTNVKDEAKGEPQVLWLHDHGMSVVGYGIIVHNDTIKEKPDVIRGFVAATIKAFEYARQNPDEAVAALVKAQPEVKRPTNKDEFLNWVKFGWDTPNTKGKPLGWMSDKDWQNTQLLLEKYAEQPKGVAIENYYTNEFLPK